MPRDALYDEKACERETDRYELRDGICGICIAVCPWDAWGVVATLAPLPSAPPLTLRLRPVRRS